MAANSWQAAAMDRGADQAVDWGARPVVERADACKFVKIQGGSAGERIEKHAPLFGASEVAREMGGVDPSCAPERAKGGEM